MRTGYSWWWFCPVAAGLVMTVVMTPAQARKAAPEPPHARHEVAGAVAEQPVARAGAGAEAAPQPAKVMSAIDLSQVSSSSVVIPPKGNGKNEIVLMDERPTKTDPNVTVIPSTGFLIIDIRQSTGIGNSQVNAAQIHTP